jgi:hypothetical protein
MVNINDVQAAANALHRGFSAILNSNHTGKLFEAWLMLEIGLVLRSRRWTVSWVDPGRHGGMIFRGGPGSLNPTTALEPGYLSLTRGGKDYEIHNSIRYRGASGVSHEVDISALSRSNADAARLNKTAPQGLPRMALELKNYSDSMGIGLTRSALMSFLDLSYFCFPRPPAHLILPRFFISAVVTSANGVGSSEALLQFYGSKILRNVKPDPSIRPGLHPCIRALCIGL